MKSFPMKKVKSYMDKIYDKYRGDNFWEVKGSKGGDTLRMRFYDDGMITEK